jgi:hypothetical protein
MRRGMTGITANIYAGLHDLADKAFAERRRRFVSG